MRRGAKGALERGEYQQNSWKSGCSPCRGPQSPPAAHTRLSRFEPPFLPLSSRLRGPSPPRTHRLSIPSPQWTSLVSLGLRLSTLSLPLLPASQPFSYCQCQCQCQWHSPGPSRAVQCQAVLTSHLLPFWDPPSESPPSILSSSASSSPSSASLSRSTPILTPSSQSHPLPTLFSSSSPSTIRTLSLQQLAIIPISSTFAHPCS